eukprot:366458-Chlamydomonas_euryale.AAC.26
MKPAARLLKHESERDLPAQVVADDIDILLIQVRGARTPSVGVVRAWRPGGGALVDSGGQGC